MKLTEDKGLYIIAMLTAFLIGWYLPLVTLGFLVGCIFGWILRDLRPTSPPSSADAANRPASR